MTQKIACKDFHLWLRTRDIHKDQNNPGVLSHMAECKDCQRLYTLDTDLEQGVALAFTQEEMPQGLVDQIDQGLDHETCQPFFRSLGLKRPGTRSTTILKYTGWIAGFTIMVLILSLVLTPPTPSFKNLGQISEQAVVDHLKGNRQINFTQANIGQALEMLRKELGFNVLLPNFNDPFLKDKGLLLLGGRLCLLGKCRAAYFTIEKQGEKGSLFIMDYDHLDFKMADGCRFSTKNKGCTTDIWKNNGQVYAMVF
jgi:hypothetical protein